MLTTPKMTREAPSKLGFSLEKVWREDGNLLVSRSFHGLQDFHSSVLTHTHSLSPPQELVELLGYE